MAAKSPIPRRPEDEDWSLAKREGYEAFFANATELRRTSDVADQERAEGWSLAYARAFGQGVKAAEQHDPANGIDCETSPYEQFSAAWEAWAEGWDSNPYLPTEF